MFLENTVSYSPLPSREVILSGISGLQPMDPQQMQVFIHFAILGYCFRQFRASVFLSTQSSYQATFLFSIYTFCFDFRQLVQHLPFLLIFHGFFLHSVQFLSKYLWRLPVHFQLKSFVFFLYGFPFLSFVFYRLFYLPVFSQIQALNGFYLDCSFPQQQEQPSPRSPMYYYILLYPIMLNQFTKRHSQSFFST